MWKKGFTSSYNIAYWDVDTEHTHEMMIIYGFAPRRGGYKMRLWTNAGKSNNTSVLNTKMCVHSSILYDTS